MKTDYRNTVICDLPVIEQIIIDYWKFREDHESSQKDLSASQYWFSLLSLYSDLVINIEACDFDELAKTNPIFRHLKKNSLTGGSKIQPWKDHLAIIEKENRIEDFQNALYLLNCSEDFCNQKTNEYGLIFLNGDNYRTFTEKLFLHTDLQIKKNRERSDITSWNDLKRLAHPMNSMILTDNYIVKEIDDIAINLIPLLDALLPANLENSKFQLMIITLEMEPVKFSIRYTEVIKQLKKLKRNYEIELSFISTSLEYNHDRRIYTNYCMFESNNSFTYFNAKGNVKKDTILRSFPCYMISSGQELMLNKNLNTLVEVNNIIKNHIRQKEGVESETGNRLLSIIGN